MMADLPGLGAGGQVDKSSSKQEMVERSAGSGDLYALDEGLKLFQEMFLMFLSVSCKSLHKL